MLMVRRANMGLSIAAGRRNRKGPGLPHQDGATAAGRVSCNRHARADVACHHAAGTDHRTIADGHAGQDDGAAADPDIAADPDRTPEFETLARVMASRGWSAA